MLGWTGWNFSSISNQVDETRMPNEPVRDYVLRLAETKCNTEITEAGKGDFILAADTVVVLDNQILGKPVDAEHAKLMLKSLCGRQHQVISGIAVRKNMNCDVLVDMCQSYVQMRHYTDDEIDAYVHSGDAMDKAGSYAIQNPDFNPVIDFAGCFASVMGLPLCHLERTLMQFRDYLFANLAEKCQKQLDYHCPIHKSIMAGDEIG
jgi:septum formation protein